VDAAFFAMCVHYSRAVRYVLTTFDDPTILFVIISILYIIIYYSTPGDAPTKLRANKALGRWVSTQRANYKRFIKGEITDLEEHEEAQRRIRLLDELGFSWSMLPTDDGIDDDDDDSMSSGTDDPEDYIDV
jgi:hypothetical protein